MLHPWAEAGLADPYRRYVTAFLSASLRVNNGTVSSALVEGHRRCSRWREPEAEALAERTLVSVTVEI